MVIQDGKEQLNRREIDCLHGHPWKQLSLSSPPNLKDPHLVEVPQWGEQLEGSPKWFDRHGEVTLGWSGENEFHYRHRCCKTFYLESTLHLC
eukprot:3345073-Amphidinium_carterae.1